MFMYEIELLKLTALLLILTNKFSNREPELVFSLLGRNALTHLVYSTISQHRLWDRHPRQAKNKQSKVKSFINKVRSDAFVDRQARHPNLKCANVQVRGLCPLFLFRFFRDRCKLVCMECCQFHFGRGWREILLAHLIIHRRYQVLQ